MSTPDHERRCCALFEYGAIELVRVAPTAARPSEPWSTHMRVSEEMVQSALQALTTEPFPTSRWPRRPRGLASHSDAKNRMRTVVPQDLLTLLADDERFVIAGGAALAAVTAWDHPRTTGAARVVMESDTRDVDIFVIASETGDIATKIANMVASIGGATYLSARAVTATFGEDLRLQFVPCRHDSKQHLLASFDLDACKVLYWPYDGCFYMMPSAKAAIETGVCCIHTVKRSQELDLAARIVRYVSKGFRIQFAPGSAPPTGWWAKRASQFSGLDRLRLLMASIADPGVADRFRKMQRLLDAFDGVAHDARRVRNLLKASSNFYGDTSEMNMHRQLKDYLQRGSASRARRAEIALALQRRQSRLADVIELCDMTEQRLPMPDACVSSFLCARVRPPALGAGSEEGGGVDMEPDEDMVVQMDEVFAFSRSGEPIRGAHLAFACAPTQEAADRLNLPERVRKAFHVAAPAREEAAGVDLQPGAAPRDY